MASALKSMLTPSQKGGENGANLQKGPAPLEDIQHEDLGSLDAMQPVYATRLAMHPACAREMPEHTMPAHMAKALVQDMRQLDWNPRLNLSTFVNTWVEPECKEVVVDALAVNQADAVQYPSTMEMERRCVRMLARLWHCPDDNFMGTGTVGSTEACYLGGLAMKKNWQAKRREAGLPTDRPNIVFGHIAQVCWTKFCSYWDVEARYIDVHEGCLVTDPSKLAGLIDENTIGVVAMFASTYTGQLEDVQAFNKVLEDVKQERGLDVPLHVDAANAGLVIPLTRPDLVWDFQLSHVMSINFSGHKYGLTYCGCAFVVFRHRDWVPRDMVFVVDYLGEQESNITINFSRPAAQIVGQFYNFLRLGKEGYRRIFENLLGAYKYLANKLEQTGHFEVLSTGDMPVLAFRLKGRRTYNEYDLMHRLSQFHWMVPAYKMAPQATDMHLLRICLRVGFDLEMAERLVKDLLKCIDMLDKHTSSLMKSEGQAFLKEQEARQKELKQHVGPC